MLWQKNHLRYLKCFTFAGTKLLFWNEMLKFTLFLYFILRFPFGVSIISLNMYICVDRCLRNIGQKVPFFVFNFSFFYVCFFVDILQSLYIRQFLIIYIQPYHFLISDWKINWDLINKINKCISSFLLSCLNSMIRFKHLIIQISLRFINICFYIIYLSKIWMLTDRCCIPCLLAIRPTIFSQPDDLLHLILKNNWTIGNAIVYDRKIVLLLV